MDILYEDESEFQYDINEPETQESYTTLTQEDYNNNYNIKIYILYINYSLDSPPTTYVQL
jgi:hypothetical protein